MAANLAHHLTAVDSESGIDLAAEVNRPLSHAEQSDVCAFCYGTGMEVVPGKGARRCRCRTEDRMTKLMEAAHIPRRYSGCILLVFSAAFSPDGKRVMTASRDGTTSKHA